MKPTIRVIAAVMLLATLVCFTACGKDDTTPANNTDITAIATVPSTTAATAQTDSATDVTTTTTPGGETTAPTTAPTDTEPTPEPDVESEIVARFATVDELEDIASTMLIINDTEYASPVILEAVGTVTDVSILKLDMVMDESGTYKVVETLSAYATLSNGEKKAVLIDFPGDFSAWGLSYVDSMGVTREHTLYMSGEDGSLVMADGIM